MLVSVPAQQDITLTPPTENVLNTVLPVTSLTPLLIPVFKSAPYSTLLTPFLDIALQYVLKTGLATPPLMYVWRPAQILISLIKPLGYVV